MGLSNTQTHPFQGPPRGHPQQCDSVLHMPFIYFALEHRPDAWLFPVADVCQGSAALPGCDYKCVHRLQTHAQTVTNCSRRGLDAFTNILARKRERMCKRLACKDLVHSGRQEHLTYTSVFAWHIHDTAKQQVFNNSCLTLCQINRSETIISSEAAGL